MINTRNYWLWPRGHALWTATLAVAACVIAFVFQSPLSIAQNRCHLPSRCLVHILISLHYRLLHSAWVPHILFFSLSLCLSRFVLHFVLKVSLIENTIGAHLYFEHFLHQNAIKSIINISTLHIVLCVYKFRLVVVILILLQLNTKTKCLCMYLTEGKSNVKWSWRAAIIVYCPVCVYFLEKFVDGCTEQTIEREREKKHNTLWSLLTGEYKIAIHWKSTQLELKCSNEMKRFLFIYVFTLIGRFYSVTPH